MPESIQTPPTLLSITAATAKPDAAARDDGFAESLAEATAHAEPPPRNEKAPKRSEEQSEAPNTTAADESPLEDTASEQRVLDEPASDDGGEELLSFATAIETLVVETLPNADLPETAGTQVDVVSSENLGSTLALDVDATEAEVGITDGLAVEVDQSLDGEPDAGIVETEATVSVAGVDDPTGDSDALLLDAETTDSTPQRFASGEGEANGLGANEQALSPYAATSDRLPGQNASAPEASDGPSQSAQGSVESTPSSESEQEPSEAATRIPLGGPDGDASAKSDTGAVADRAGVETAAPTREVTSPVGTEPSSRSVEGSSSLTQSEASESRPAVDPQRFVSRVARAFDIAQERGGGPIELRLSPPELGSLQVKIELREGVLTAALETETPAARQTLLDNLPALRDRLEQQQIRIEKFDVDVRDDSQQRGGDWQPSNQQRDETGQDSGRRDPTATARDSPAEESTSTTGATRQSIEFGPDEINLVA